MWVKLREQTGTRRVPLHALLHTCVSLLLTLGVHPRVVMEIVGHGAMEMTMNIYGHVNFDTQRAALDRLDDEPSGWPRCCQPALSIRLSRAVAETCTSLTCRSAARVRTWTIRTKI